MPCFLDVNPHPHFGHRNSIGALHSTQNLAPSELPNWHFGHFIVLPPKETLQKPF